MILVTTVITFTHRGVGLRLGRTVWRRAEAEIDAALESILSHLMLNILSSLMLGTWDDDVVQLLGLIEEEDIEILNQVLVRSLQNKEIEILLRTDSTC
jgi:hypothetical protein